jgi:Protein of unknown function (DUF2637)
VNADHHLDHHPAHHKTGASTASTPPAAVASRAARAGMRLLITGIGLLLLGVVVAPIALSSQDIVAWAGAPDGLGLVRPWDVLTFVALDAAAAVCVGMVVVAAWRGEPAGAFGLLVWAFAAGSAYANYRHGTRPGAPGDAWWFFPAMSVAGPALLEVTVRRIRRWVQTSAGRYEHPLPHFRLARWLIALPETWRAWRLAVTEGYWRPEDAILAARIIRASRADHPGPPDTHATPDIWPTAGDANPLSPPTRPDSLMVPPASPLSATSPLSVAMVSPDSMAVAASNGRALSLDMPDDILGDHRGDTRGDSANDGEQATADAAQDPTHRSDGDRATPGTQVTPDSVPSRRQQRGTRPRAAPGDATARLDAAYGDGTNPATGRPWTSRPLAKAAGVHHGTAATYLRTLRQPGQPGQPEQPSAPAQAPPLPDADQGQLKPAAAGDPATNPAMEVAVDLGGGWSLEAAR